VRSFAVLAVAVAALAVAGRAAASEQHPTLTEISGEVLCVSCDQPLDMSSGTFADRERALIRSWIAAGYTKSQIERRLVDQFGERVLLSPPDSGFNILVWWLPIVGVLAGALALGFLAWRWSRGRRDPPPGPTQTLEPDVERRLDSELARYDA
jgi:cytochrome c-type biogenesis protein CcmH/NrfF